MAAAEKPVPRRITDLIDWYDRLSTRKRVLYLSLKSSQILIAAAIPVIALVRLGEQAAIAGGILGAVLVVIEGFQQLGQFQQDWVRYRSTNLSLQREVAMYQAAAGVYAADASLAALVERTEAIIAAENANWSELQQQRARSSAKE